MNGTVHRNKLRNTKQQYIPKEDKVTTNRTEQKCNLPHICKPKIIEIYDEQPHCMHSIKFISVSIAT
jgi:hypothetical protein